ncbi:MAG: hypothetical protein ACLFTB_02885 [Desulfovibrionales bacterium]
MNLKEIPRKQRIAAAGTVLVLLVLVFGVVLPLRQYNMRLEQRITQTENALQEILLLEKELAQARAQASKNTARVRDDSNFTLFAYLENAASGQGIKEKIDFMRPSERSSEGVTQEVVEMRLGSIRLATLVPFLHQVETGTDMAHIQRLAIRSQTRDPGLLDVDLLAVTYRPSS